MCRTDRRGLVLVLNPAALLLHGATCHVFNKSWAVQKSRFFLFVREADDGNFWLTPLFSKSGLHRVLIEKVAMLGHPKFLKKTFYYILGTEPKYNQIWVASKAAISEAAKEAGDLSTEEEPNSIKDDAVPDLTFEKD